MLQPKLFFLGFLFLVTVGCLLFASFKDDSVESSIIASLRTSRELFGTILFGAGNEWIEYNFDDDTDIFDVGSMGSPTVAPTPVISGTGYITYGYFGGSTCDAPLAEYYYITALGICIPDGSESYIVNFDYLENDGDYEYVYVIYSYFYDSSCSGEPYESFSSEFEASCTEGSSISYSSAFPSLPDATYFTSSYYTNSAACDSGLTFALHSYFYPLNVCFNEDEEYLTCSVAQGTYSYGFFEDYGCGGYPYESFTEPLLTCSDDSSNAESCYSPLQPTQPPTLAPVTLPPTPTPTSGPTAVNVPTGYITFSDFGGDNCEAFVPEYFYVTALGICYQDGDSESYILSFNSELSDGSSQTIYVDYSYYYGTGCSGDAYSIVEQEFGTASCSYGTFYSHSTTFPSFPVTTYVSSSAYVTAEACEGGLQFSQSFYLYPLNVCLDNYEEYLSCSVVGGTYSLGYFDEDSSCEGTPYATDTLPLKSCLGSSGYYTSLSCYDPLQPTSPPTPTPTSTNMCESFNVVDTNYDTVNYATCFIYACPGATVVASGCNSECVGDQYFILYNQAGSEVAVNDDGAGSKCGLCSEITYPTTQACQTYFLHEGCYADDACEGQTYVTGGETQITLAPSPAPTPASPFDCPKYTVLDTDEDTVNYNSCFVYACPGTTLTLSGCNADCEGDQYLRLFNSTGFQVDYNDDGCGDGVYSLCAQIEYTTTESCQTYALHEGCVSNDQCSGVISVTGGQEATDDVFDVKSSTGNAQPHSSASGGAAVLEKQSKTFLRA